MKPYFNSISGKSKSDIITLDGGLNTCTDKSSIRDSQLQFMMNVTPINSPTLSTRSNRTSMAWFLEDTTTYGSKEVLAMFASSEKILYTIEGKTDDTEFGYVYRHKTLSPMKREYVGKVQYSTKYSITECKDSSFSYIIISTLQKRYSFKETWTDLEPTVIVECEDNNAGIVCEHKNRLWVAYGNMLKFTKLREFSNFTITEKDNESAGEIQVTTGKGNITALVSYDDKLMVFCDRSWHVVYGDSPYSEVNQFSLVDMNDGVGCISDKTVTVCDRKLFWIDRDLGVYRYNGSYVYKVSEPNSTSTYAQYGGIKNIGITSVNKKKIEMTSYDNYVYIACRLGLPLTEEKGNNDTLLVYDAKNKVWWAEDGAFSHIIKWDTDVNTPYYRETDYLIGSGYDGDILILNLYQNSGEDTLFNFTTRGFEQKPIEYKFETKTWNLGQVKRKKTLTNLWFQANANAKVAVCDYWSEHNPWDKSLDLDKDYLIVGKLLPTVVRHDVKKQRTYSHEGGERQCAYIPRMYMQKINAFSIRVEGSGKAEFYMLEKEWRIR